MRNQDGNFTLTAPVLLRSPNLRATTASDSKPSDVLLGCLAHQIFGRKCRSGLLGGGSGCFCRPVGLRKLNSPEMRCRGYKFQSNALSFFCVVPEINDAALLVLLRERVGEYQQ